MIRNQLATSASTSSYRACSFTCLAERKPSVLAPGRQLPTSWLVTVVISISVVHAYVAGIPD